MGRKQGSIKELVDLGMTSEENLNCSETILHAADRVYGLQLSPDALKLSAGFGGGMGVEKCCGALTGGVMAVSALFVKGSAKTDESFKEINREIFEAVERELGTTDCAALKARHRDEVEGCKPIIARIGGIVESVIDSKRGV